MKKYINSLIRKHRKLDKQISESRTDMEQIHAMKLLQLKLKGHITFLRHGPERRMT